MFSLHVPAMNGEREVLGHDLVLVDDVETAKLQILREALESVVIVEVGTEGQASCPCEDGSDRVG